MSSSSGTIRDKKNTFQNMEKRFDWFRGDRVRPWLACPNAHFGRSDIIQGLKRDAATISRQVLGCKFKIMNNFDANWIAGFFNSSMIIDCPYLVNGLIDIPSSCMALGDNHSIAWSKPMFLTIIIAQTSMSFQNIKDFCDSLGIWRRPTAFGTPPTSYPKRSIISKLSSGFMRFSPISCGTCAFAGQVVETEIVQWGVKMQGCWLCCCCWWWWYS
mmetsp:Transcript_14791/g.19357  ORF Transcript_14791/g.19357 Transcript_14791/m.19357 type:complete len:215 (-) Transcript_14791:377-1021(-)